MYSCLQSPQMTGDRLHRLGGGEPDGTDLSVFGTPYTPGLHGRSCGATNGGNERPEDGRLMESEWLPDGGKEKFREGGTWGEEGQGIHADPASPFSTRLATAITFMYLETIMCLASHLSLSLASGCNAAS